jgi:hypothetical protein
VARALKTSSKPTKRRRKAVPETRDVDVPFRLVGGIERELNRLQPDMNSPVRTALLEQGHKWIELISTVELAAVVPILAKYSQYEVGVINPGPPPGVDSA